MANLSAAEQTGLIRAFSDLRFDLDLLLIDTAAGFYDTVLRFSHAAHHVVLVVCDEPASITDACALIKVLSREYGMTSFQVLANQTRSPDEGRELYSKIVSICDRSVTVSLQFLGSVPHDNSVRRAIQQQSAVVEAHPDSEAARAFITLAAKADQWAVPHGARGHLEFFIERLVLAESAASGGLQ